MLDDERSAAVLHEAEPVNHGLDVVNRAVDRLPVIVVHSKAVISHDMKYGEYGEYTADGQVFMYSNEGVPMDADARFKARLAVFLSQRARSADEPMIADFAKHFAAMYPTEFVLAMIGFASMFAQHPWRSARPLSSLMSYGVEPNGIDAFLRRYTSRVKFTGDWKDTRTLDDLWMAVNSVPAPDWAKHVASGAENTTTTVHPETKRETATEFRICFRGSRRRSRQHLKP